MVSFLVVFLMIFLGPIHSNWANFIFRVLGILCLMKVYLESFFFISFFSWLNAWKSDLSRE